MERPSKRSCRGSCGTVTSSSDGLANPPRERPERGERYGLREELRVVRLTGQPVTQGRKMCQGPQRLSHCGQNISKPGLPVSRRWRANCRTGSQLRAGDGSSFAVGQGNVAVKPVQPASVWARSPTAGRCGHSRSPRLSPCPTGRWSGRPSRWHAAGSGWVQACWHSYAAHFREFVSAGTARQSFVGFPLASYPVAAKTRTGRGLRQGTSRGS